MSLTTSVFSAANKPIYFDKIDNPPIEYIIEISLEPVSPNRIFGFTENQPLMRDDMKIIWLIDSGKGLSISLFKHSNKIKLVEFIVEAIKIVSSFKCLSRRFNEMLTKEKIISIVVSHFHKCGLFVTPEVISYFVVPQNMIKADMFLAAHQEEIALMNTQDGIRSCKKFKHPRHSNLTHCVIS